VRRRLAEHDRAPSARRTASGTRAARIVVPHAVSTPAVSNRSLTASGTPHSATLRGLRLARLTPRTVDAQGLEGAERRVDLVDALGEHVEHLDRRQ
jgi:hypothetical protein